MSTTLLRAMARNYANGHFWDHLDGEACLKAADRIEQLEAENKKLTLYKQLADEYGLSVFADLAELEKQRDELSKLCAFNERTMQDLIKQNAELLAALETVVANAPEPYCAITRRVDAQCRAAIASVKEPK